LGKTLGFACVNLWLKMRVAAITWNVATKKPPVPSLVPLMDHLQSKPDLLFVSFQEILSQALAPFAYTGTNTDSTKLKPWIRIILSALSERFDTEFEVVSGGFICAIGIIAIMPQASPFTLKNLKTGSVGTGLAGIY